MPESPRLSDRSLRPLQIAGLLALAVLLALPTLARWLGVDVERSIPDDPVVVVGDPAFTERALANLVENATRHNVSGGHVAVVLDTDEGDFVLRVLDDGPGLTRDECERALRCDAHSDAVR